MVAGHYVHTGTPVVLSAEMAANQTELDELTKQVVATGLATWTGEGPKGVWGGNLISRRGKGA